MDNREANYANHPPTCTCKECNDRRLARLGKTNKPFFKKDPPSNDRKFLKGNRSKIPYWVTSLLLLFALSIIGLSLSFISNNFTLLWILLGFSIIFSIEKWLYYILSASKYKKIGNLYRLSLNLCLLALFGITIHTGVKLFSQQLVLSSLVDSLVFIVQISFFIWLWRIVSRNTWKFPSMKLTICTLIILAVILAFAGVEPLSSYKDLAINKTTSTINNIKNSIPNKLSISTSNVATVDKMLIDLLGNHLFVNLSPNSSAIAFQAYNVDLYEKGNFRDRTTIQWNQAEINVATTKHVSFPITSQEQKAYCNASFHNRNWWKSIFTVKVYKP